MKQVLKHYARKIGLRRTSLASARMCCERHVISAVAAQRQRAVGRILCYHSVGQRAWGVNDVSPARFRKHIELALKAGFRFVPASEIARTGGAPDELAVTFDDGLKSVLTDAAPLLNDYDIPWSIFPVSEWCEHHERFEPNTILTWDEVETLMGYGAELGSHSATHPDFGAIGLDQIQDELGDSRDMLHRRLGVAPTTFAIPLGQSANWTPAAARAARAVGYETIFAQAEETRPQGTIARTFVTRFDDERIFKALLGGAFDRWEEWV